MDYYIKSIIKNSFKQLKNLNETRMKTEPFATGFSEKYVVSSLAVASYGLECRNICPSVSHKCLPTVPVVSFKRVVLELPLDDLHMKLRKTKLGTSY